VFEGANVPAFATDDPALHLFVGDCHHRHGRFGALVGGEALDGEGDDAAGLIVRLLAGGSFDLAGAAGGLDLDLLLHPLDDVGARFIASQAGDPLQLLDLALHGLVDLFVAGLDLLLPLGDLAIAALEGFDLAVEVFLLLLQAALTLLELAAALARFGLDRVPELQGLVICLQENLVFSSGGFGFDALGSRLGELGLLGDDALASEEAHRAADQGSQDQPEDQEEVHVPFTSLQDRARLLSAHG